MTAYRRIIHVLEDAGKTLDDLRGLDNRELRFSSGLIQLLKGSGIIRRIGIQRTHEGRYLWGEGPMYSAFMEAWKDVATRRI